MLGQAENWHINWVVNKSLLQTNQSQQNVVSNHPVAGLDKVEDLLTGDERGDDEGEDHEFEESHEELPGVRDVDDGQVVQVVRSAEDRLTRLAELIACHKVEKYRKTH